jgi:tRNA nucleotidyltransferase/poly(A) polymerase
MAVNTPLEWTGRFVLSAPLPQAPCLPFRGSVSRACRPKELLMMLTCLIKHNSKERMTSALAKIERRKKARREVEEIHKNEMLALIIHYSCESFYDRESEQTPRITSIAARNFASGQTESFSIHKIAELAACPPKEIESRYDELEKKMLGEFFDFLESHASYD